jgi:hypothetical protein
MLGCWGLFNFKIKTPRFDQVFDMSLARMMTIGERVQTDLQGHCAALSQEWRRGMRCAA